MRMDLVEAMRRLRRAPGFTAVALLARPRLVAWLVSAFAALALLLATVGIYGTIALLVSERSQEIGIRLALGAQRGAILRLVVSQGAALAGTGIAAGIALALYLTRFLASLVYGVTTLDPVTFAAVPCVLGLVALLATLVPARQAAALDPMRTLRR